MSVLPAIAIALFLDTGHSNFDGLIAIGLVAIGCLASYRGMVGVESLWAKVLFGIPAGMNTFGLLFTAAVPFGFLGS